MIALLRSSALALLLLAMPAVGATCSATSGERTLPVVELYTSEGCDSCPPADRWLRETFPTAATSSAAAVLAFHVDYWDALGWTDRFAAHAYTERQQAAVRANDARTAYTPQVLVQGRDRGLWREARVADVVRTSSGQGPKASIALRADVGADGVALDVDAALETPSRDLADETLHVALTESGLRSRVTAGENGGKELVHDHVVRALLSAPFDRSGKARATLRFAWPKERGEHPRLVAFVQDRRSGEMLQAVTMAVCGAR